MRNKQISCVWPNLLAVWLLTSGIGSAEPINLGYSGTGVSGTLR